MKLFFDIKITQFQIKVQKYTLKSASTQKRLKPQKPLNQWNFLLEFKYTNTSEMKSF